MQELEVLNKQEIQASRVTSSKYVVFTLGINMCLRVRLDPIPVSWPLCKWTPASFGALENIMQTAAVAATVSEQAAALLAVGASCHGDVMQIVPHNEMHTDQS